MAPHPVDPQSGEIIWSGVVMAGVTVAIASALVARLLRRKPWQPSSRSG